MTNLLRRCENCVNGWGKNTYSVKCTPKLPFWAVDIIHDIADLTQIVHNESAEYCPAFRLRAIGENHNV